MEHEHAAIESGPGYFWLLLDAAYERAFAERYRTLLKRLVVPVSIAGFVVHLLLIFLARHLTAPPPLIAEVGRNYLAAISTPFNFILFYEVLTLIATLAASTTRAIASQFEIVSLIFIRDVFRDIAEASDLTVRHRLTWEAAPVLVDMWAGFLMFLLVALFRQVAAQRARASEAAPLAAVLKRFVAQKKAVSLALGLLLMAMAAWDVCVFAASVWQLARTGQGGMLAVTNFYNDLFTVMIFTDVLVLILSLVVSGQYEMVFRNAAFVVSIILIRFSLTEGFPLGAPLAVLAMVFGLATLMVFNYHMRLSGGTTG
jgi:hypothetical protein